jgi:CubicO group peptidase (beta-lactamase class C family)
MKEQPFGSKNGWGFACQTVRLSLLLALAQFAALPVAAANWVARHGLTSAQYQNTFTDLAGKGFRLVSVSGYESGGQARYAALWTRQQGPDWAARHGLTSQQYQAAFDDFSKKGYRLTFVNGHAVGNSVFYAAIWERKAGPSGSVRHGLTAAQYQETVNDMVKQGFALTHVSAYSVNGSPRFAAIFEKGGPDWVARHGLTPAAYQQAFNDFSKQGYRLKVVSGYRDGNSDRYAAIWTKAGGPQWSARHGVPGAHYQHVFDNYTYQSWEPVYVEAFNSASGVRFNGIWENSAFAGQDLALIHSKVQAYMNKNNVPALSLAISRNGKLVYAAAFGLADKENGEPAGPAHRFRIASVSKPITRVAIETLKGADLNEKVFGPNSILGGQYSTPPNNRKINGITVGHLVNHTSGFVNVNKDGQNSDPMFAYTGTDHKGLIEWTLKEYPLGFDPGKDNSYSNFGYCLLGRVIEAKTRQSYEAYVRDAILKPAGASGMLIGGDKEADRKPNEVKYYGSGAYSSVKPVRFDSHGGWIATPIDLLRFLRGQNVLPISYSHYGAMAGTKAVLRRRSDGFAFAAVSNTSDGGTDQINALLSEIVDEVSSWPNVNLF